MVSANLVLAANQLLRIQHSWVALVIPVHTVHLAEACSGVLTPFNQRKLSKTNFSFRFLCQRRSPSVGGRSKTQALEVPKAKERIWQSFYLRSQGLPEECFGLSKSNCPSLKRCSWKVERDVPHWQKLSVYLQVSDTVVKTPICNGQSWILSGCFFRNITCLWQCICFLMLEVGNTEIVKKCYYDSFSTWNTSVLTKF